MIRQLNIIRVLLFSSLLSFLLVINAYAERKTYPENSNYAKSVSIAIVTDGTGTTFEKHSKLLQTEVSKLLDGEYTITFYDGDEFDGRWSVQKIQEVFAAAQNRDDIDLVIAHGLVSSHVAINAMHLKKPTIATLFLDSDLQSVPKEGKTSGRHNLTYIQNEKSFLKDIKRYREIAPFETLAVIGDPSLRQIPEFQQMLEEAKRRVKEVGIKFIFIPDNGNVKSILSEIDNTITENDAVYLLPNERLSDEGLSVLGAELIKRKIPAFAMLDSQVIEHGFLAVYSHENSYKRAHRRIALNIKDILDGVPAKDLNVYIEIDYQLYINQQTLNALGLDLTWSTLRNAKMVNTVNAVNMVNANSVESSHLTLPQMAKEALESNLQLMIERKALAAGMSDVDIANAKRLPQLSFGLQQTMLDDDRAKFSNGSSAERDLSASLTLQQVIYNESAWSNVYAQKFLQQSRQYNFSVTELDVLQQSTLAYISVLRALSLVEIETSNLDLTKANLKRAERRVVAGVARKSEIYRWQSQVAGNKRSLLDAKANYKNSLLQINQLLNRPLNTVFTVDKIDKQHAIFDFNRKIISQYLTGPSALEGFTNRSEQYAVKHAPELKSIKAIIIAQERLLKAKKRQYYVPDVSVQMTVQQHLDKAGNGDEYPVGVDIDDTDVSAAVVLSLPLYSGGERRAEVAQQLNTLYQLRYQQASVEVSIKQRVRSAFNQLSASFPGIGLSESALVAAKRNYEMVRDSYERGTVSIVDFLDAQNQVFAAERSSANATYDYLEDYIRYQRSIGYFFYFDDPKGIYSILFNDTSTAESDTDIKR